MQNLTIIPNQNQHNIQDKKDESQNKSLIKIESNQQSQKVNNQNQDHSNYFLVCQQKEQSKKFSQNFHNQKDFSLQQKSIINQQNFFCFNKKKLKDKNLQINYKKDLHFIQKTTIAFKQRFRNKYNKINKIGQIIKVSNSVSVSLTPRSMNKDFKELKFNKKRLNTTNSRTSQQQLQSISFKKKFNKNNQNKFCLTNKINQNFISKKTKSLQTSKVNLKSNRSVQDNKKNNFANEQDSVDNVNNIKDNKQDYFSIKEEDNQETITKINKRRTLTPASKYANFSKDLYQINRLKGVDQNRILQRKNKNIEKSYIFFDEQQKSQQQKEKEFKQLQNEQALLQEQIKILNQKHTKQFKLKKEKQSNHNQRCNENKQKSPISSSNQKKTSKQTFQKEQNENENENILPLSLKIKEKVPNFNCKQHFSKKMIKRIQIIRKQRQLSKQKQQLRQTKSNKQKQNKDNANNILLLPKIKVQLPQQQMKQQNHKNQLRAKSIR